MLAFQKQIVVGIKTCLNHKIEFSLTLLIMGFSEFTLDEFTS